MRRDHDLDVAVASFSGCERFVVVEQLKLIPCGPRSQIWELAEDKQQPRKMNTRASQSVDSPTRIMPTVAAARR